MVAALATPGPERGYPPSIGTVALREAVARWIERRFGVAVPIGAIGACIGSKEFVGTLPQWLRLRAPDRDTVLYPAASYPTYEMGAILAWCRPVAVPMTAAGGVDLTAIDPADAEPGAVPVGQQPVQPDRRARRPRRRRRVGPRPRRARVLRRVLRRVHVGRTGAQHPRARPRRRRRRALAVEALQPRRRADRLLRRRPRARALPPGGAQARRDDGARSGAGGRRRRPRRRRARGGPARALPPAARADGRDPRRLDGHVDRAAGRRLLPVVPGRRRLGVHRAAGRRGRGDRRSRRVLRRRPATSASPWCNRTTASSSSPLAWGCEGWARRRVRRVARHRAASWSASSPPSPCGSAPADATTTPSPSWPLPRSGATPRWCSTRRARTRSSSRPKAQIGRIEGDCAIRRPELRRRRRCRASTLTLVDDDGDNVDLDRTSGPTYDRDGKQGTGVRSVDIDRTGSYVLTATAATTPRR